MTADVAVGGGISTLSLDVAQLGADMGCARTALYNNGGSPEDAVQRAGTPILAIADADNNRVRLISQDGTITSVAGDGSRER